MFSEAEYYINQLNFDLIESKKRNNIIQKFKRELSQRKHQLESQEH